MCIVIKACFTINPCACLYKKKSCMTRVIGGRCHEYIFVATKHLFCRGRCFVAAKVCLSQQNVCIIFVCRDKKRKKKKKKRDLWQLPPMIVPYCARRYRCKCNAGYFDNNGVCDPVKKVGQACAGANQCVVNAQCSSVKGGVCQCLPGFFDVLGDCKSEIPAGLPCTGPAQCVANAECMGGVCKCNTGFINRAGVCQSLVPAGDPCGPTDICVENSDCSSASNVCECSSRFFNDFGVCTPLKKAGEICTGFGQCVDNAECSTRGGGVCLCDSGFYSENGICLPLRDAGIPCSKDEQCTFSATCVSGEYHPPPTTRVPLLLNNRSRTVQVFRWCYVLGLRSTGGGWGRG